VRTCWAGLEQTGAFGPATHWICVKTVEEGGKNAANAVEQIVSTLRSRDETYVRGGRVWSKPARSGPLHIRLGVKTVESAREMSRLM
jgi:hypothetical protein